MKQMTFWIMLFIYFGALVFLTGFTELVSFMGKLIFYVASSLFKTVIIQYEQSWKNKGHLC